MLKRQRPLPNFLITRVDGFLELISSRGQEVMKLATGMLTQNKQALREMTIGLDLRTSHFLKGNREELIRYEQTLRHLSCNGITFCQCSRCPS